MFTLDQLTYFVETATEEHVGRAARALGVSPSTVSQSLANLEALLGQPLFLRAGKGIHLNGAGVAFLKRAQALLGELRGLHADFAAGAGEPSGVFRMAATHSLATAMAKIWVGIAERHTQLSGDLRSVMSNDVSTLVSTRVVDFGLRYSKAKDQPALEQETVLEAGITVCVRRSHPVLRHPAAERYQRLRALPAAVPRSFDPLGEDAASPLAAFLRSPVPDFIYDSYDAAMLVVSRTDAWTMLPSWLFQRNREKLREIETPTRLAGAEVVATWRKDSPQAAFHAYVVNEVRADLSRRG